MTGPERGMMAPERGMMEPELGMMEPERGMMAPGSAHLDTYTRHPCTLRSQHHRQARLFDPMRRYSSPPMPISRRQLPLCQERRPLGRNRNLERLFHPPCSNLFEPASIFVIMPVNILRSPSRSPLLAPPRPRLSRKGLPK